MKLKLTILSMLIITFDSLHIYAQTINPICLDYHYGYSNYPLGCFYDSFTGTKYLHGFGLGSASPIESGMRKSTGINCFENDTSFDTIYCEVHDMTRYNGNLWVAGYNAVIPASGNSYYANLIEYRPSGPYIYSVSNGMYNNGTIGGMKVLNGDLYVFGDFDSIAGVRADKIAKYDGSTWSSFPLINDVNVNITSAEWYQGELYIGGRFTDPGQGLLNIGRFNGTNWHSVGTGFPSGSSQVGAMMVYDNKLVVGGGMHTSHGDIGNCIQAWNGTTWSTFGSGFDAPFWYGVGELDTLNGELWAAGWFESSIYNVKNLAKWNGSTWDGMNINIDPNLLVNDIQVTPDGVYITGWFKQVNGDSSLGKVFRIDNTVGLPHAVGEEFGIYPNPTSGSVEMTGVNGTNAELNIYNCLGKKLFSQKVPLANNKINVDISSFTSGIYILEIINSGKSVKRKVMKI